MVKVETLKEDGFVRILRCREVIGFGIRCDLPIWRRVALIDISLIWKLRLGG